MNPPLCIAGFRHDLRLTRQLNAFELRHFFLLLDFGGSLRDRTFVPAKKREELRLTLGFGSSELAREKMDKRLRRYHELELIRLYDDDSILLTFLLDQEAEEDEHAPALRPEALHFSAGGNGSGSQGANGTHGERRGGPERRQPGRVYSQNPEAVRKREEYRAARAAENGQAAPETLGENLRDFASKPPAISGDYAPDGTQNPRAETSGEISENLRPGPEVFPVCVGSNSRLESGERDLNKSSYSGFEFEAEKNLRAKTSGDQTETSGPNPPAHRPETAVRPEPPALAAEMVKVKRAEAVKAVLALTNDPPVNRHLWLKYWDICHLSGNLPAWDEAQDRLRKALVSRSEEIGVRAAWLTTALRRLLEENQVFMPTKAQLAEQSAEDIRALVAESLAGADPEPETAAAVAVPVPNVSQSSDVYQRSGGRITPLADQSEEDIYESQSEEDQ